MRPEKEAILREITEKVQKAGFCLLADYQGMTVEQSAALRASLRPSGARMQVVKNRLLRLACREKGWSALDPHLKRASAMVIGTDVVEAAKAIKKFRTEPRNQNRPDMKAGMMGDRFLSVTDIETLATLPTLEVLRGQVAGTLAAPMTRLAGVFSRKLGSVVQVLKAAADKKAAAEAA